MKATVTSTQPGVGQLFAVAQKSFGSIGAAILHLLRGLADDVIVLAIRSGDTLVLGLLSTASDFSVPGQNMVTYSATATETTRTAYDWTRSATGGSLSPSLPTMPTGAVSLQSLIDNQFVDDGRFLYISQVDGVVAIGNSSSDIPETADIPVVELTLSSGNRWE